MATVQRLIEVVQAYSVGAFFYFRDLIIRDARNEPVREVLKPPRLLVDIVRVNRFCRPSRNGRFYVAISRVGQIVNISRSQDEAFTGLCNKIAELAQVRHLPGI